MHSPHNKKLLIVEDNEPIRSLYTLKFRQEGYLTVAAENGEQGLATAEAEMPDLILLDLMMPVMGGTEMLTRLRATKWGSSIRVVILTNLGKEEAPHALRFLGVDRYVTKVYHTPAQIVQIVREVIA